MLNKVFINLQLENNLCIFVILMNLFNLKFIINAPQTNKSFGSIIFSNNKKKPPIFDFPSNIKNMYSFFNY